MAFIVARSRGNGEWPGFHRAPVILLDPALNLRVIKSAVEKSRSLSDKNRGESIEVTMVVRQIASAA
jgi:hypothetical protein